MERAEDHPFRSSTKLHQRGGGNHRYSAGHNFVKRLSCGRCDMIRAERQKAMIVGNTMKNLSVPRKRRYGLRAGKIDGEPWTLEAESESDSVRRC